jgi:protein-tyrosine phosphatase
MIGSHNQPIYRLSLGAQGITRVQSEKRFPDLAGALNFRDMGGYLAVDGRRIRWKRLYRSGTTHAMTGADLEHLSAGGIRYAYDLRSNGERRYQPNRLTSIDDLEYRFLDHDRISGDITRALRDSEALPEHSRNMMTSIYRRLPYDFRDAYSELFQHLANDDLPLVFNCAAGKDRTGVAAALILTALGVPRETVLEDYLLTDQCFDRSCELILQGTRKHPFAGVKREVWEPVMRVDGAYLTAMFEQVNVSHGSVENYLAQDLGVGDQTLERIRHHLLE